MSATDERTVKGYILKHGCEFVDQHLPARSAQIRAAAPGVFKLCEGIDFNGMYPLAHLNELTRAMVDGLSPQEAYDTIFRFGQHIGGVALGTFLRLVARFFRPSIFGRKLGDLFRRDHSFGLVTADLSKVDQKTFVMDLKELEGYHQAGALSCGWVSIPLGEMGCKNLKFTDQKSAVPAPQTAAEYSYVITWD